MLMSEKMKFTHRNKMRVILSAILGIFCLVSTPATADFCQPYWTAAYKCAQGCGSCGGSPRNPGNDDGAERRAQQAEAAAAAERQRQQAAEAERIERERIAAKKRADDAAFIRDRDAAANSLKGSTGGGDAMSQLKGVVGSDNSGLKGSGFDSGSSGLKELHGSDRTDGQKVRPQPTRPAPHTDTSVVDARVPRDGAYLTNQLPELKQSPAADRITKGFQAVINHDWPVALAWWQDALNRDPNNAALKRSVDLAQWMVDRRKAKAAGPSTPLGSAIHSASRRDSKEAIRQFELAKKENPAIAAQADSMINALQQRQAKEAKDAKVAAYWNGEIKKQTQRLVDDLFETGMNRLSIGDEKGAQEAFNDATFIGGLGNVQPSQLPASKSGKTK